MKTALFHLFSHSSLSLSSTPHPAPERGIESPLHCHIQNPHPRISAITDIGLVRDSNEDAFRICADRNVFVVADGMGGERSGEIASLIAVETFMEEAALCFNSAVELLRTSFAKAQSAVLDRAKRDIDCAGMGAALVAVAIESNLLHVGHLGDSRAYVVHNNMFTRLTTDHSTISKHVMKGELTWEEARLHSAKNTLYKAIGIGGESAPDFISMCLDTGDRLLLCTDGLWDELPDEQIEAVLKSDGELCDLSQMLVNRALASGGNDNITVLLYQH